VRSRPAAGRRRGRSSPARRTSPAVSPPPRRSVRPTGRRPSSSSPTGTRRREPSRRGRLMEPRVPIFPVVPAVSRLPPAVVRRLVTPALVPAHAVLPLEAVVEGHGAGPTAAALDIHVNGGSLVPVPIEIGPGTSVVRLRTASRRRGRTCSRPASSCPRARAWPAPSPPR
jgi:hypothetical protein